VKPKKTYNNGFYEYESRNRHNKTYNDFSTHNFQPSTSSKPFYPKDNNSHAEGRRSSARFVSQYGTNKSLGVNPEDLFNFTLSPFDEKMSALPSPNIVIATPGSANASATS
jgi:hypothetical protein